MSAWKLVPVEPTDALLRSMAIRYDHGLGVPGYYDQPPVARDGITHEMRLKSALTTMRQLHEEVVGTGFAACPDPAADEALVERVARAMAGKDNWSALDERDRHGWRTIARAALRAMEEEP